MARLPITAMTETNDSIAENRDVWVKLQARVQTKHEKGDEGKVYMIRVQHRV